MDIVTYALSKKYTNKSIASAMIRAKSISQENDKIKIVTSDNTVFYLDIDGLFTDAERAKLAAFSNDLSRLDISETGEILIDGSLIKADSATTKDIVSTVECGAIKVGDKVKASTNLQGIVEQLLIKEEAPSVTVSLTVSDGKTYNTIREIGDSVSVTAKAVVTKKSYDVASTSWTTPSAISETAIANGGTYTRVFNNVSNTTTFTFKAVDNKNLTGSNFKKVTFVYPMYCSLVDKDMDTATITADDVTNGTKILKSKATFDYVVTANAEKVVWAIPQSYGQLKSIKDTKNGLELISGYEVTTLNITALDGTTVPYYVYVRVLESTVRDFNNRLTW